jgi:hypothetical protein
MESRGVADGMTPDASAELLQSISLNIAGGATFDWQEALTAMKNTGILWIVCCPMLMRRVHTSQICDGEFQTTWGGPLECDSWIAAPFATVASTPLPSTPLPISQNGSWPDIHDFGETRIVNSSSS